MKSKKGFALSIVMWIVAALLLGIVLILNLSRDSLALTKGVQEKLTARLQAQSYLEVLKYYVLTADYDSMKLMNDVQLSQYKLPKQIMLDGRKYNVSKNVTFSMQDTSSMVNLFYPSMEAIASVISRDNQELYYAIVDSIKDWIDKDSNVRLNGAEGAYYKKQKTAHYRPRNYPALQNAEELRLIKGMDTLSEKSFEKLKQNINISQRGALPNLALVNTEYLAQLLHIEIPVAQQLEQYKYDDYEKFRKIIQKNSYYDYDQMGFWLSFNINIKVETRVGDAIVRLETFMDFRHNQYREITTSFYRIY
jgi:type II secretory pathway component PulK